MDGIASIRQIAPNQVKIVVLFLRTSTNKEASLTTISSWLVVDGLAYASVRVHGA